jgi:hypothetical protein
MCIKVFQTPIVGAAGGVLEEKRMSLTSDAHINIALNIYGNWSKFRILV